MAPPYSASTCKLIDVDVDVNDDSDESYEEDGVRFMNREERSRYYQALRESDGFDVPTFPDDTYAFGLIEPIWDKYLSEPELRDCVDVALEGYNKENGTNFEFLKIKKANHQASMCLMYYITFEAKQIGTEFPITFEAKVLSGIDFAKEVYLCRQKRSV